MFRRDARMLFEAVVRTATGDATPSLLDDPAEMGLVLNTLRQWESRLLREYERALEALGVPADSLGA